jgi:hypothetical protein
MNEEKPNLFKHGFQFIVTKPSHDSDTYRVAIVARQLMSVRDATSKPVSKPAKVTIGTRPELSVLAFQPPEHHWGMSEEDYAEAALDFVRALSDRRSCRSRSAE